MYNKVELCGMNTAQLPVLTEAEKRELLARVRTGDAAARERMVEGNLRLVLSVVQRFAQRGENLDDLFARHPEAAGALWLATTKAPREYTQAHFTPDSWLFFGKETAGLPEAFRAAHRERCIRLPMRREARSLNLSNSVAILTYEALRQNGFPGLTGQGEMAEE